MPAARRAPAGLRRSLTFVDLTAIGVNATVGSGIFLLPDDLFRAMGPYSPFSFVLCVAGLMPIAWCFAEAASTTETTGGPYEYARRELGPAWGYAVGWMCFVNAIFSFAAVASAAAAYASRLFPSTVGEVGRPLLAMSTIFAFGALNYIGAKPGAWAIKVFTLGKLAVLLLLMLVLLPEMNWSPISETRTDQAHVGGIRGMSAAAFMALFALQGFETVPVPAGEARAPTVQVPMTIMTTLATTGLLYLVVQTILVFSFDQLAVESDAPLADAALALSPSLGLVVAGGALISTLGFVSGSALGTPRYLFAMAAHRQLPANLAALHPVFRTPHLAILITSAIAAALVLPLDYRTLIGMSNVAVAVQYGATCFAVMRAGTRAKTARRSKRLVLSSLGLAASSAICFAASRVELLFASTALVLGFGLFFASRRAIRQERHT